MGEVIWMGESTEVIFRKYSLPKKKKKIQSARHVFVSAFPARMLIHSTTRA